MKRQTPCQEWADKLIASHTDALPLPEYLVLKEHLLTCPACTAAHNRYLSVEAQIRSLPVLQPQRQLSAELLVQQKGYARPRSVPLYKRVATIRGYAATIRSVSYRMLCQLAAQIRKPVYALVALLLCLLTAGIGAATLHHSATTLKAPAPHLAVSTTWLDLSPIKDASFSTQSPHYAMEQSVFASGALTLRNTGERTLTWHLDTTRSMVIYAPGAVRLWTIPSHGTLIRNEHSLIKVIAGGITSTDLTAKQDIELGYIFFTSNGGNASIHTTLKSTAKPESYLAPQSDLPKTSLQYLAAPPTYVHRRQNL